MRRTIPGWQLGLAFNLLFWLAMAALGFPRTYWDDSVIIGPALSLAQSGTLRNIYLSQRFYPGDMYLFYPATFFWVLAGWLTVFGKSVASLALFWAACGLVTSTSLAAILARFARTNIAWVVAPILVFGCVAYTGHRYEILAFATFFAGLALATAGRRGVGYFLLVLTPTVAPTFLATCTIAVVAIFLRHRRGRLGREIGLVAAGLVLACLVLVAGVFGNVAGLVETMYQYRDVRVGVGGRSIFAAKTIGAIIALDLLAALGWFALSRKGWRSVRVQLPLLLAFAMALTLVSHARPAMIVAMNIAAITLAALAIADALAAVRWRPPAIVAASRHLPALGLAGVGAILAVLNIGYARTIAIMPLDPALASAARRAVAQTAADRVVVADPRVVKDALDFPTIPRIEDAMIRNAWPAYAADYDALPANERWVMSRAALVAALDPTLVPTSRGRLDYLFIASGMGRVAVDDICFIGPDVARRWRGQPPAARIAAACGPVAGI